MKKIYSFVFSYLIFTLHLPAQWVQQNSNTATLLSGIHCTDASNCFAAGNTGIARKTTDGGTTWTVSNTSTFTNMSFVKMYDLNNVWAGKTNGTFHYTSNAGATWSQVSVGNPAHTLYDVFFHDASNFIAVGGNPTNHTTGGQIIATSTDGGATWIPVNNSGLPAMFGIHCFSSSVCVVCAGAEIIYKTSDGGANWTVKHSGTTKTLYDIHFSSASVGYAVGGDPANPATGAVALKTADGGETWNALTLPVSNTLYGVHFVDTSKGYAVGNGGVILTTSNGGATWSQQASPVSSDLNKIFFANDTVGYIAGAGGVILKTTNGGSATGISEIYFSEQAWITYNPHNAEVWLQTGFPLHNAYLLIYNPLGQLLETKQNISGNKILLSSSALAGKGGICFFQLKYEGKEFRGKFLAGLR